jgi:LysR family glycine cleavage system transcriptional activator
MDWRDIPSLAALRGFEAAARLRSLTLAARELNVTHAAIAQHVRTLEDHFGRVLLERDGRGMAPSADGALLAAGLGDGFGQIAVTVEELMPDEDRALRIAMTPSFAENWLMPVIGHFWSAHPEIQVELLPASRVMDMRKDAIDLAIRYGAGKWPGTDPKPLASANLLAVAAPGTVEAETHSRLADLADQHWLLEPSRPEAHVWAKGQGLDLSTVRMTPFDTNALLLQAVRGGAGVTLMPEALVARDITEGRLVPLFRETSSEFAYHLVRRSGRSPKTLETFVAWLRRLAKEADKRAS